MKQFADSHICKSRNYCKVCRSRNAGQAFRLNAVDKYAVPNQVVNFECPAGMPWIQDVSPKRRWKEIAPSWHQATEYAKAKASKGAIKLGLLSPVSSEQRDIRQQSCHGDPAKGIPPCPMRAYSPQKKWHYCAPCGCGDKEDARVSAEGSESGSPILLEEENDKFSHPYLACPLDRAGFSNDKKHIIIRQEEGLGDATVLSGVVRDLHLAFPNKFSVEFRGWAAPIFYGCPHFDYVTHEIPRTGSASMGEITVECYLNEFPETKEHIQEILARKLSQAIKFHIPTTKFGGDTRLLPPEKEAFKALPFSGERYVILNPGSKRTGGSITVKQPNVGEIRKVVQHFLGKVLFVQVGGQYAYNPDIPGAYRFIEEPNENTLRKAMIAMYGAVGTLGPISWPMHLSQSLETIPGRPPRWSVVIAGGRERSSLVRYPNQTILNKIGHYECCLKDACYKTNTDTDCLLPVLSPSVPFKMAKCMEDTTAHEMIEAIERHERI
jgi:hypothetical protein